MEKNLDIMKPLYGEHSLPVPWPFVKSRLHCNMTQKKVEFQLVLWISSCHILLVQDHFLLVLVNNLVRR